MNELESLQSCGLCDSKQLDAVDQDNFISKCKSCGYVFDNPRPSAEAIKRFYSQPEKYDSWLGEEQARDCLWKRRLKKIRRTVDSGSLLDIGTGIGQFLHHAENYYKVCGTEVSKSAIKIAKNRYDLSIIQGEIIDIEFNKENPFTIVTLFHVLEHVSNPKKVLEKCSSLLSQGGSLVIAVPNDVISLKSKIKILLSKIGVKRFRNLGRLGLPKITLDGSLSEIHLSHFTSVTLETHLKEMGFFIVENSLDPYYASNGLTLLLNHLHYFFSWCFMRLFKANIYDAIWIVAKKL